MNRVFPLSILPLVLLLAAFQVPSPPELQDCEALNALLAQAELYYRTRPGGTQQNEQPLQSESALKANQVKSFFVSLAPPLRSVSLSVVGVMHPR
jgi:hypothetical protein